MKSHDLGFEEAHSPMAARWHVGRPEWAVFTFPTSSIPSFSHFVRGGVAGKPRVAREQTHSLLFFPHVLLFRSSIHPPWRAWRCHARASNERLDGMLPRIFPQTLVPVAPPGCLRSARGRPPRPRLLATGGRFFLWGRRVVCCCCLFGGEPPRL